MRPSPATRLAIQHEPTESPLLLPLSSGAPIATAVAYTAVFSAMGFRDALHYPLPWQNPAAPTWPSLVRDQVLFSTLD